MARYIDTNYLFKCQTCRHFDGDECDTFCDSYECYSPDMPKMPTADVVEVKHGYWMLDGRCSECLENPLTTHKTYCPNCGARMDGVKCLI